MDKIFQDHHIAYPRLVERAFLGLIRDILQDVSQHGLRGEHHFYITYNTQMPGVTLSQRVLQQYPEHITIVLQHDFENLRTEENGFRVTLGFHGINEEIYVPFRAIMAFHDPHSGFQLSFENPKDNDNESTSNLINETSTSTLESHVSDNVVSVDFTKHKK